MFPGQLSTSTSTIIVTINESQLLPKGGLIDDLKIIEERKLLLKSKHLPNNS